MKLFIGNKMESKVKAAAMAHATHGRKTTFKSANEVRLAARLAEYDEEIAEALEHIRNEKP